MSDRREIAELADVSENRLTWPQHKPRAARRTGSPFKAPEVATEERKIREELKRWRITRYMISRNHQRLFAGDPGVAVWWDDPKDKSLRVLACDRYERIGDNAHAIYLTLEALRGLDRWGAYTGGEATEGARLALPPPDAGPKWWIVLGVDRSWPLEAIEAIWREKMRRVHPDAGGTGTLAEASALNVAFDQAAEEKGR